MRQRRTLIAASLLLLAMHHRGQAEIDVTVGMAHPERHFFQIEIAFDVDPSIPTVVGMPVWTPGSYKVRDYARNVENVRAVAPDGRPLTVTKIDKSRWQLDTKGTERVILKYDVFAFERTVRTSYLDSNQGYMNPASAIVYLEGRLDEAIRTSFDAASEWKVDTPLRNHPSGGFLARDYDELVDSPILIGEQRRHDFMVAGKEHRAVFIGESNLKEPEMVADMTKIVETAAEFFGDLPYDYGRYLFMTHLLERGSGGLEHRNGTSMMTRAWRFDKKSEWDGFLELVAHEYFHLWNVKRIHDVALGPFDYTKENYTRLLWVHEGWTVFFAPRLLRMANLIEAKEVRARYEGWINDYKTRPGRLVQPLDEASHDAWIKAYQTNETTANSTVSYYGHGATVAFCLDLILRHESENQASLDDVMKRLNDDFARQDIGITPSDVQRLLVEYGGEAADRFWTQHVVGTDDIPFETYVAYAGLRLTEEKKADVAKTANVKTDVVRTAEATTTEATTAEAATEQDTTEQDTTEQDTTEQDTTEQVTAEETAAIDPEETSSEATRDDESPPVAERHPWDLPLLVDVGFSTKTIDGNLAVDKVHRGSNAWDAGMAMNDEIVAIDDSRVTPGNWTKLLALRSAGESLSLLVTREGTLQRVALPLVTKAPKWKLTTHADATDLDRAIYAGIFLEPYPASDSKSADAPEANK